MHTVNLIISAVRPHGNVGVRVLPGRSAPTEG